MIDWPPVDPVLIVAISIGCIAVLLIIATVSSRSPRRGLVAVVIAWIGLMAPMAIDQPRTATDVLTNGITPIDIVRGGLPMVALMLASVIGRPALKAPRLTEAAAIAFAVVSITSAAWSISPSSTLLKASALLTAYLLVFVVTRLDAEAGRSTIDSLAFTVHLTVLSTLLWLLVAHDRALIYLQYDPTPRLAGVFPFVAPNLLAYWAVAGILLLSANVQPRLALGWRLILTGAYLSVILLTRTRSEIAILAIGLGVLMFLRGSRQRALLAVVTPLAVVVIATAALFTADPILTFLARGQDPTQLVSLTGRTITWQQALQLWGTKPALGLGYYAGHRFGINLGPGSVEFSNIDSMWIETLLDTGILGSGVLGLFVTVSCYRLFQRRRPVDTEPYLAVRRALFLVGIGASYINPSLQGVNYGMVLLAAVIFAAPHVGSAPKETIGARPSISLVPAQRVALRGAGQ